MESSNAVISLSQLLRDINTLRSIFCIVLAMQSLNSNVRSIIFASFCYCPVRPVECMSKTANVKGPRIHIPHKLLFFIPFRWHVYVYEVESENLPFDIPC